MSQRTDLLLADELAGHTHHMTMVPRLWKSFSIGRRTLAWSVFPFKATSRKSIPNRHGVYAFLIVPGIAGNLDVSYLMYIGETERPLRTRFADYLLEAKSDQIRPKLLRILPRYCNHLVFACAPLPNNVQPKFVEAALIEAFVPPANDQLPATIRRGRKAF